MKHLQVWDELDFELEKRAMKQQVCSKYCGDSPNYGFDLLRLNRYYFDETVMNLGMKLKWVTRPMEYHIFSLEAQLIWPQLLPAHFEA